MDGPDLIQDGMAKENAKLRGLLCRVLYWMTEFAGDIDVGKLEEDIREAVDSELDSE